MKSFRLSPEAAEDIREIWSYIAADNPEAASRVRVRLLEACRRLAENPRLGHIRRDITEEPVLFWPIGAYLILYDPSSQPLSIVRVIHGARDIPGLL